MKYEPQKIEKKWQAKWEKEGIYRCESETSKKPKKYILGMFPYPSGTGLHVGHCRIYTAVDVIARWYRAKGFNVLNPQGWDAFGLPAENDAVKKKVNPNNLVPSNIAHFKKQCEIMGLGYDWTREVNTSSPKYYKWTQWLFLKLYEAQCLYQADIPINWCTFCKTGLADEEVLPGGIHERCGKPVIRKKMKQWLFKITDYADRLLSDLKELDWPSGILEMQKNWIGKSVGAKVKFPLSDTNQEEYVEVFTTRIDTIFGVTGLVLAPEHPLVSKALKGDRAKEVKEYLSKAERKSELERTSLQKEKTGVFSGIYCFNPINKEKIPIWIGDYVIGWYGGGAVMLVPAHDERDFQFAKKYNLEIRLVVKPSSKTLNNPLEQAYEGDGTLINSGKYNKLTSKQAKERIIKDLKKQGLAEKSISYHLRDWNFSRQRYWGEPIPLIHCPKCGIVPVPYKDLPLELPFLAKYEPTKTGKSPLSTVSEWVNTKCPKCGGPAKRETDTMPNWAGSCWYFLRFADPHNKTKPFDKEKADFWHPVDWYIGGAEHAVLHLLYARYWIKVFYDLGLVSFKEPFKKLSSVGMVLSEDGRKMSKSLGNVVNPDNLIKEYGADSLRVYEMFMGPFSQATSWSTNSLIGCLRFLEKVWNLSDQVIERKKYVRTSPILIYQLNELIKKVDSDLEKMKFNTSIAAMMKFINSCSSEKNNISEKELKIFLKLLSPFAPHITEELWQRLGEKFSIHQTSWPEYNPNIINKESITFIIEINGKVRDKIVILRSINKKEAEELSLSSEKIQKWISDKKIKNTVFIKDKLINIII